jgi:hypothetical protein
MPKLRKARIFGEEKYKEGWKKISKTIADLNLSKSSRMLEEAEKEFKVIL